MLTYAIIKGEDALIRYCRRRWNDRPRFVETIGHIANVTIELHYYRSPTDAGYMPYYLLIMEHKDGKYSSMNQIREEAYELVETGKACLLNA